MFAFHYNYIDMHVAFLLWATATDMNVFFNLLNKYVVELA